jgi:hypothetical protein
MLVQVSAPPEIEDNVFPVMEVHVKAPQVIALVPQVMLPLALIEKVYNAPDVA